MHVQKIKIEILWRTYMHRPWAQTHYADDTAFLECMDLDHPPLGAAHNSLDVSMQKTTHNIH